MVSRQIFDSSIKAKVEKDPNQPLNIYAGSDTFLAIGEPEVRGYELIRVGVKHERQGIV